MITNNLNWKAAAIARLYRNRWNIETFFKLFNKNINVIISIIYEPLIRYVLNY